MHRNITSKPDNIVAKKELWQQILTAFNEQTGLDSSVSKLQKLFSRMKSGKDLNKKYLEYDQSLKKWKFYKNDVNEESYHYGEPERQTLLNLLETLDTSQILLSKHISPGTTKPENMAAKKELWQQILTAFNELTGRESSVPKLQSLFYRMKSGSCCGLNKKYLEYDQSLKKWKFYKNDISLS